ncbi:MULTISPECIES: hypothetical protein [unclassified Arthrobacter]|uniref:hypothetical protein n=1 Tax=unclassified Arthrobacter TaxID=235627 RepID=UPI001492F361|nr:MULTISPECIES: hypothetical protein [unclassified Arthrobacter]MBE0008683.1 hypothetical protein [Arthrobacter sp. AET 35A]NOJ62516.1 hypothetical protein [Arthrobacter sp. 147(2020)]
MRWDALFLDLESQFAAADLIAVENEIAERTRLEQASVPLMDRLRGQTGSVVRIRTRCGTVFSGAVHHVGAQWLVLDTGSGPAMIPATAIGSVEGLGRHTAPARSAVTARLGLGSVFRAFARDRTPLTIQLAADGARINGTIDRVGRDFLELASVPSGELRRTDSVAAVLLIPFSSVDAVLTPA